VLASAAALFAERGIEGTSVDAIASHSGVSKATIYKHWPDKKALWLEALGRLHGLHLPRPSFRTGDLRRDLIAFLSYAPPAECQEQRERTMPSVMAYAARDPEFGRAWREHVIGRTVQDATEIIQRGIEEGRLDSSLHTEFGVSLLVGPLLFQKMFGSAVDLPDDLAALIADAFLRAHGVPPAEDS